MLATKTSRLPCWPAWRHDRRLPRTCYGASSTHDQTLKRTTHIEFLNAQLCLLCSALAGCYPKCCPSHWLQRLLPLTVIQPLLDCVRHLRTVRNGLPSRQCQSAAAACRPTLSRHLAAASLCSEAPFAAAHADRKYLAPQSKTRLILWWPRCCARMARHRSSAASMNPHQGRGEATALQSP